jgi:hypothetical protein
MPQTALPDTREVPVDQVGPYLAFQRVISNVFENQEHAVQRPHTAAEGFGHDRGPHHEHLAALANTKLWLIPNASLTRSKTGVLGAGK